jgi:flagellar P-ring protein precursor FlgI
MAARMDITSPKATMRILSALVAFCLAFTAVPALAKSRIKDIVQFEGNRTNLLIGHGMVVGLAGTGDNMRNSPQSLQAAQSMLERNGINVRDANFNSKNMASVIVTATLPAFAATGSRIDVTVSAMGDAKSLQGGTLLVTALEGADGQVYAVAQGTVQTGSVSASGSSGSSVSKGVPTSGRIPNGADIEKEIAFSMEEMQTRGQRLTLRNPDFTTASRIADAINARFPGTAQAQNATIVATRPPPGMRINDFTIAIENLEVQPESAAKVVIDEVNGIIVAGEAVRISTVILQQGNLVISVREAPIAVPAAPFTPGQTTTLPQSAVSITEEAGPGHQFVLLQEGASIGALAAGLNALGVSVRDMIQILQAIKSQGGLQAELEVI